MAVNAAHWSLQSHRVSISTHNNFITKVVNGNILSFFFRSVFSLPFSTDPGGNRSWRFRAIDITIQVSGDPALQVAVEEALEGATSVLRGLEFGPLPLNSRARLCAELERHPISTPLPTLPARKITSMSMSSRCSVKVSPSSPSFLDDILFSTPPPTSPTSAVSSLTSTTCNSLPGSSIVVNVPHSSPSFLDEIFFPSISMSPPTSPTFKCTPAIPSLPPTTPSFLDELFDPDLCMSQYQCSPTTAVSSLSPSSPSFVDELFDPDLCMSRHHSTPTTTSSIPSNSLKNVFFFFKNHQFNKRFT